MPDTRHPDLSVAGTGHGVGASATERHRSAVWLARLPYRNPFVWAFVTGAIVLTSMRPLLRRVPEPPAVSGRMPAIEMVDQSQQPVSIGGHSGRVYIAAAVSLECAPPCPAILSGMRQIQAAYRERRIDGIHLLSIPTDPDPIDGERLAAFAAKAGADPTMWHFVTAEPAARTAALAALASTKDARILSIIDAEGQLRGQYRVDELGLDEVFNRAQHVRREVGQ